MTTRFIVERKNLRHTQWARTDSEAPPAGSVRLRVELFTLTSNNITYAAFGDAMNYWAFFPTGDPSTGCIPVWGFGSVIESQCAEIPAGERYYGYFPMADEAVLAPARIDDRGFFDGAAHRRELHAVYNQYLRCRTDPLNDPAREAERALLQPLFITSFLIDDFLADNGYFGARAVVIASASSKTAYGTAFCLARRRGSPSAMKVIGLTSAANAAFARGLGCYDEVFTYDAVKTLPAERPTVYVDMSGSVAVRAAIHEHLNAQLKYSCSVGGTHWDNLGDGKGLAGPRPVLFFAPAQIRKRNAEWGADGLQSRMAETWRTFMAHVTDKTRPWLIVVRGSGPPAVEATYAALLDGKVPAREGHVLNV
jgi:hypothetical protein